MPQTYLVVLKLDDRQDRDDAIEIANRIGDELGAQRITVREYDPKTHEAWHVYASAVG